jgi:D-alanyl-D-alanine carboxypeptidase/D-alanyl-D-alanine-endopeptidase (penicillin-binding protein 4)
VSDEEPLTRRAAREAAEAAKNSRRTASPAPSAEPATEVIGAVAPAAAGRRKGFSELVAQHPNAWMFSALAVIFLLLGTGAVFAGVAVGSDDAKAVAGVVKSETPTPEPPRPAPSEVPAATALRTCSISALAKDPRLLKFAGSVVNASTGEVLFDRAATAAAPPASVLKVLTAAAALATIGPDFRMSTRVLEGSAPGSIVLVGGGDPTLSALPPGVESFYRGAPKMADLAAQTIAKWNETHAEDDPITSVILDASYWNPSDKWDPSWERSEQTEGYHSEVTALMVDGDRANAQRSTSPRGNDPIGRAGKAFVNALGLGHPVDVTTGVAASGTPLLAEVKSQPIGVLLAQMLLPSDNTLGEMIARVISRQTGGGGSSASLATVIPAALTRYGLDMTGLTIRDGSGLSANNLVPPLLVSQLMAKVLGGELGLKVLYDALPVAGKSGSLASRFSGSNSVARGAVFAKTGWIKTSRTLAGIVHAADGTPLAFAFYALGPVRSDATIALDTVTTGAYRCGNNLSNN